jgi:hypothetical protein
VSYGFATDAPKVFVRLQHIPGEFPDPYAADFDGDGLTNQQEFALQADPLSTDSDADLIPDGWEAAQGLDPAKASIAFDDTLDSDRDGLLDSWKVQHFGNLAQGYFDDFDRDGVCNGESQWAGTDPSLNPNFIDVSPPIWPQAAQLNASDESDDGFLLRWQPAADEQSWTP